MDQGEFCDLLRQIINAFINTISQQTPGSPGRQLLQARHRGSDLAYARFHKFLTKNLRANGPSDLNITGVFRAFYLVSGESSPLCDLSIWTTRLLIARHGARESEGQKLTSSPRGARSTASASTLWFNSSIREDASPKPPGCGATGSNDQVVGLPDRAVS